MALKRKIILQGTPLIQEEDQAGAATIKPGYLLNFSAGKLIKNSTANAAIKMLALERDEMGDDIDDAYATNDYVKVGHFGGGMKALGFIASGQNLTKYGLLEAAGDGTFRALSSGAPIAMAAETLDYRNVSTADGRFAVWFL